MPETAVLDLTAEDVTTAAWDELTRMMLNGDQPQLAARSCNCDPPSATLACSSSQSGGAGCIHLHG
jgi:hypothetical protein